MDGLKRAAKRGTWEFDRMALRFVEKRGECEQEIARAIVADPDTSIGATRASGIGPEHFRIWRDAQLIFIAANDDQCRALGRRWMLRMAYRLLVSEGEDDGADWLADEVANTPSTTPFLLFIGVHLLCLDLLAMDAAHRDAQEHYRHACRILERRVGA